MVITKARKYEEIRSQLKKDEKIWVISCNSCVRFSGTGGQEKMQEMVDKLKNDGFEVSGSTLLGVACVRELVKEKVDAETILMLSCDAGVFNIERELKPKNLVKVLLTLGIGVRDLKGNYTLVKEFK